MSTKNLPSTRVMGLAPFCLRKCRFGEKNGSEQENTVTGVLFQCVHIFWSEFTFGPFHGREKDNALKWLVGLHSGPSGLSLLSTYPVNWLTLSRIVYNPTNEQCCPRVPSFLTRFPHSLKCPSRAYPSDNLAPMLPPSSSVPWVLANGKHSLDSLVMPGCSSMRTLTTPYYHNSSIIIIVIATLNVSLFSHQFTMNDSMVSILWWRERKPRGVKEVAQGHRDSEWWPPLRT